jgi:hypothetical protein
MVARHGSSGDASSSMNKQHTHQLATRKAHSTSTQLPSPPRNPGLGLTYPLATLVVATTIIQMGLSLPWKRVKPVLLRFLDRRFYQVAPLGPRPIIITDT